MINQIHIGNFTSYFRNNSTFSRS